MANKLQNRIVHVMNHAFLMPDNLLHWEGNHFFKNNYWFFSLYVKGKN